MFHVDPGDSESPRISAAGWGRRVQHNSSALVRGLTRNAAHVGWPGARIVVVALIGIGFALAVRRRFSPLEWFAAIYVLVSLACLYAWLALTGLSRWSAERLGRPRWTTAATVALFTVLLAGNLLALPGNLTRERSGDLQSIAEWIRANTAEDAVILCGQAPILAVLTDRPTFTYQWAHRGERTEPLEMLARHGVDYVVFESMAKASRNAPGFPEAVAGLAVESWELPSEVEGKRSVVYRVSGQSM
jgi:hypothetical protein